MTELPPSSPSLSGSLDSHPGRPFFVYVVAAIAALAGLLFGFDTGVISGAMLYIKTTWAQVATNPYLQGAITSAVVAGAIFGSLLGGVLAERFGRRNVIIITSVIFAVGSIGTAFAPNPHILIVGRIFIGIAIGIASFAAPMYISEVAPPEARGGLVSLNQLMITIGIMMSYGVDWGFSVLADGGTISGSHAWGWMLGIGALPALILGVGMAFLPESPRWLASHRGAPAARAVLTRIRGTDQVEHELREIEASQSFPDGGWKDLRQPWLRPLLIVGIGLGIFQQITGINTVIYYAPTILESAGFRDASGAIEGTTLVGLVNVLMTVVAVWLLDRVGRRPLLLVGMAGMGLALAVLGACFHFNWLQTQPWLAVACLMLYVASFAISLGPIFWLIIAEIYPLQSRARAMSLATMIQWAANLVVTFSFPAMLANLGSAGTFLLFAVLTVAGWFFALALVPETKGVTLEEIEEHARAGKPLRRIGQAA